MQKYGINATEYLLKHSQEVIQKLDVVMKETGKANTDSLDLEKFKFTKKLIDDFKSAKSGLLD